MKLSNNALLLVVLLLCGLCLTTGCKKKNPDNRQDVQGMITLNGEPLGRDFCSAGIQFDAVGDDKSAGGHGQIMRGKYLLTQQDGVKPGKYIVRITAFATFDKTTNTYATPETTMENELQMTLVPEEFNSASTIEFEVVQGKKNVFDYDIKTDFGPTDNTSKKGPITGE
ncbi:MAG: hypothetical protein Q4G03_09540 [Planctomycetia bacterium]|nr:hypothetical protein [Planctomycetia bacterium]